MTKRRGRGEGSVYRRKDGRCVEPALSLRRWVRESALHCWPPSLFHRIVSGDEALSL